MPRMRTRNSAAAKQSGGYYQHCPNMDKETNDSYPLACSSLLPANNPRIGVNQSARGLALEPMSRFRYIEHSAHNACTQKSTRSASTKPTFTMVSIRDPHLGPGLSRTHTKLTSGHGTISAPRPCVNVLRQRAPFPSVSVAQRAQDSHMGPDIGCNRDVQRHTSIRAD